MNHSIIDKPLATAWTVILAAVCVAAADAHGAPPFTVSKETTVITDPLKADGTVDYVAAINRMYGDPITTGDNGYVLWLTATGTDALPESVRARTLAALKVGPADLPRRGMDTNEPDEWPDKPWHAADNAAAAAFLSANDKYLDIAVQASQKPQWWETATSTDGTMFQVLLPSLQRLREGSRALAGRALLRAGGGDFDGFVSDVMAIKRLTRLSSGWTLVHLLVCQADNDLADRAIAAVVASGSLTSDQCARLVMELDRIKPLPGADGVMDTGERWGMLEYIQRIAIGKANVTGLGGPNVERRFAGLTRADIDWDVALRRVNQRADEVLAIMRDPALADAHATEQALDKNIAALWALHASSQTMAKDPAETREDYSNRFADTLIPIVLPSFSKATITLRRGRMLDEITRALVAVAQYRADQSHWPATLADLVPKYLPAVPRDIYSRGATDTVHYLQSDAGIYIYSIGPNRTDDGGVTNAAQKQDDIGLGVAPNPAEQGL